MLKFFSLRPPVRLRPGFTLMEILISLVVLAIGCLAAITMQTSTMGGAAQAFNLTEATFLVESEIERLKSTAFGRVAATSPAPVSLTRDGQDCPADGSKGPCYILTTRVESRTPTSQSLWISIEVGFPGLDPDQKLVYDTLLFYLDFV